MGFVGDIFQAYVVSGKNNGFVVLGIDLFSETLKQCLIIGSAYATFADLTSSQGHHSTSSSNQELNYVITNSAVASTQNIVDMFLALPLDSSYLGYFLGH